MEISFTIPNEYIERIQTAFRVSTVAEFKDRIIKHVKNIVKNHEQEIAVDEARDSIVIEEDLIE